MKYRSIFLFSLDSEINIYFCYHQFVKLMNISIHHKIYEPNRIITKKNNIHHIIIILYVNITIKSIPKNYINLKVYLL